MVLTFFTFNKGKQQNEIYKPLSALALPAVAVAHLLQSICTHNKIIYNFLQISL